MARRKRSKRFVAIPFNGEMTVGTPANGAILLQALFDSDFGENFYAISADILFSLKGNTAGEGPRTVGIAHNDYSVTEVSEALQVELVDPSNLITKERIGRLVRTIGSFPANAVDEGLNDGKPIRVKLGFMVHEDHGLAVYHHNKTGATITTGSLLSFIGTLYGRWA